MTGAEFSKLIAWIEDRWPGTRNYRKAEELVHDFRLIEEADAWQAAREMYQEGRRSAPTASELLGEARKYAKAHGRSVDGDPCETGHTWAIIGDHDDGLRRDVQCAVCHLERVVGTTQIRSLAEIDPDKLTEGRNQW